MNYHVKEISPDGRRASVVFHIPVPTENNSSGVALRTALSQYIDSANFASQVPWVVGQAEENLIKNGELYEHSETFGFLAADNNTQKQSKLDNRYTALSVSIITKIRAILKFWGMDKNVA